MYKEFLKIANEPVDVKDTEISGFYGSKIKPRFNSATRMDVVNAFKKFFNKDNLTYIDIEEKYLKKLGESGRVKDLFQGDDKQNKVLASSILLSLSDKINNYPELVSEITNLLKDDAYGLLLLLFFELVPTSNYINNKDIISILNNNDYYIKAFVDITKEPNYAIEEYYKKKNNHGDNRDYYRMLQRKNKVPGIYSDGTRNEDMISYFNKYKYSENVLRPNNKPLRNSRESARFELVSNKDKYNDIVDYLFDALADYNNLEFNINIRSDKFKDVVSLFKNIKLLGAQGIRSLQSDPEVDSSYIEKLNKLLNKLSSDDKIDVFKKDLKSRLDKNIIKLYDTFNNSKIENINEDAVDKFLKEHEEEVDTIVRQSLLVNALFSGENYITDSVDKLRKRFLNLFNNTASKRGIDMDKVVLAYTKKYIDEFLPGLLKQAKSVKDLSSIVRVAINETQNLLFNDNQIFQLNQPEVVQQIGNTIVNTMSDDYVFPATGGAADNMSLKMIVERWKQQPEYKDVSFEELLSTAKKEMEAGKVVELEHTNDENQAAKIAADHLTEQINYYSYLHNMESLFSGEDVANKELKEPENFVTTFFKDVDNENINNAKEQDHVCDGSCGGNCQHAIQNDNGLEDEVDGAIVPIKPQTVEDKLSGLGDDIIVTVISEPEVIQPLNDNEVKVVDYINNIAANIKR